MARLVGYVLLLWLALCGLIVVACIYIAIWLVAVVAAIGVIAFRLAIGHRGDDLWRMPFTSRAARRLIVLQARYSDRR